MTSSRESRHDQERDRLVVDWNTELGFECCGCGELTLLPKGLDIVSEAWFDGFRADLAAIDQTPGR